MAVGRSRASTIRELKISLCAEPWRGLDSPLRDSTDVAEALRTLATRCIYLKRIAFDNDIGCMGWYRKCFAAETVEVVRNTFEKVEALRHFVIEWIPHEESVE